MRKRLYARKSQDSSSSGLKNPGLPAVGPENKFPLVNLSHYLAMDPHLLLGLLNTELRNHCESLDDLVKTHNLDPDLLIEKMAAADYVYQSGLNQFR